ncbi:MAG: UDP-N-acetylglucosamine acyltransferase [Microthrixaceae bacterium]
MNNIHPSAVVGPKVELGDANVIGPGVVLVGPLHIGNDNWIGPHTVIGTPAEIRGIDHTAGWEEPAQHGGLSIGDHNVIREGTCVHAPHYGRSSIGDDCYIMNNCYIGHDALVEDSVTMASTVVMGGHCRIGRGANLGLSASLHQRSIVGPGAMVGMGSVVTRPVPPHSKAYGNPARVHGTNEVGLRRSDVDLTSIEWLESLYSAWDPGSTLPVADAPGSLRADLGWFEQAVTGS